MNRMQIAMLGLLLTSLSCMKASGGQQRQGNGAAQASKKKSCKSSDKGLGSYGEDDEEWYLTQSGLWAEIKEILAAKCVSCHPGYDEYETVKQKFAAYVSLMDKDEDDAALMPKGGPKLPLEDRKKFLIWEAEGFPKTAGGSGKSDDQEDEEDDWSDDDADC